MTEMRHKFSWSIIEKFASKTFAATFPKMYAENGPIYIVILYTVNTLTTNGISMYKR